MQCLYNYPDRQSWGALLMTYLLTFVGFLEAEQVVWFLLLRALNGALFCLSMIELRFTCFPFKRLLQHLAPSFSNTPYLINTLYRADYPIQTKALIFTLHIAQILCDLLTDIIVKVTSSSTSSWESHVFRSLVNSTTVVGKRPVWL